MTLTHHPQHQLEIVPQLKDDLIEHHRTETAGEEARAIGVTPSRWPKRSC